MTEESLPERYQKPSKEQRLPTKKRWREMVREYIEINPTITPEEAFKRVKQVRQSINPNLSPKRIEQERIVEVLREERLKRQNIDPSEWALYTAVQPEEFRANNTDAGLTEQDMAHWSAKFPKGIELFVIQGTVSSGFLYDEQTSPVSAIPHMWEIYVRIKPDKMLRTPDPQIENQNEKSQS